ncbi:transcriptional regulator XRE family [Fusobacterium sp. CAG:439]|nr:transcriptional regulator XRE family [Fusobacterium sp. CAG:439]HIT92736.1 helix-turn-helix transcriptional regulator [Candidatus Stercorousia faecigallinarum]
MNRKLFGQKLKNLRKLHNFTQEKMSELIDIDVRQVARIEAGESLPSVVTLQRMAKILAVTPNDLLNFENDEANTIKTSLKSDINDILSLAKEEQLILIKKLILAVL